MRLSSASAKARSVSVDKRASTTVASGCCAVMLSEAAFVSAAGSHSYSRKRILTVPSIMSSADPGQLESSSLLPGHLRLREVI